MKKSLLISLINSFLFAITFLLLHVIPSGFGVLWIVLPYPIIIIYMFKLKFTNGQRIIGSLGTILLTYGIIMIDWSIKKGADISNEDIVAFYVIRYLHFFLIAIPFFMVIIVCVVKLWMQRKKTKNYNAM